MIINQLLTLGGEIPLHSYELGVIRQPKIKEILELPYEADDLIGYIIQMLQTYNSGIIEDSDNDCELIDFLIIINEGSKIRIQNEKKEDESKNYMDKFIKNKPYYTFLDMFVRYLSIIYNCSPDKIFLKTDNENHLLIHIENKVLIDKNNFERLIEIILLLFKIKKNDVETKTDNEDTWVSKTGSKRETELIEKFKERDRRRNEKNRLRFYDYINFLVINDKRNFNDVFEWTVFQFLTVYNGIISKEVFDIQRDIYTSCMSDLKFEDISSWKKSVKLDALKFY